MIVVGVSPTVITFESSCTPGCQTRTLHAKSRSVSGLFPVSAYCISISTVALKEIVHKQHPAAAKTCWLESDSDWTEEVVLELSDEHNVNNYFWVTAPEMT